MRKQACRLNLGVFGGAFPGLVVQTLGYNQYGFGGLV